MALRQEWPDSPPPSRYRIVGRKLVEIPHVGFPLHEGMQAVLRLAAKTYVPDDDPDPAVFVVIQVERCLMGLDAPFRESPFRSLAAWHYEAGNALSRFAHPEMKPRGDASFVVHRRLLRVLTRQIETLHLETIAERAAYEVRMRRAG